MPIWKGLINYEVHIFKGSQCIVYKVFRDLYSISHLCINEACIGALGIQIFCHFTSRDIGYFPFYFQGYGILYSTSRILL